MKSHAIKNPFIIFSTGVSILMLILSIFVSAIGFEGQTGKLIINFGANNSPILGDPIMIISIFGILAAIMLINSLLVYEIYNKERFMSYVLSSVSIVISILIFISVSMVVSLN